MKASITHKISGDVQTFDVIGYDVERGYYRFLISSKELRVVPSYDFILDIEFDWEVDIKGDKNE